MSLKILIVEDEVVISKFMTMKLEKAGYKVYGPASDVGQAISILDTQKMDMVLIDINLNGEKDGIDLAHKVKEEYQLPFIFLTALSDSKTIERVKILKPNGFLTKPFKEEDLLVSVALAGYSVAPSNRVNEDPFEDSLFIRDKKMYLKLKFNDILWFKASGTYTEIHTINGKKVIRSLLKNVEEKLPSEGFIRIHKSYIVNVKAVIGINSNKVYLEQETLPISRDAQSALLSKMRFL